MTPLFKRKEAKKHRTPIVAERRGKTRLLYTHLNGVLAKFFKTSGNAVENNLSNLSFVFSHSGLSLSEFSCRVLSEMEEEFRRKIIIIFQAHFTNCNTSLIYFAFPLTSKNKERKKGMKTHRIFVHYRKERVQISNGTMDLYFELSLGGKASDK